MNGIVIGGTRSGVGKAVVALAVIRALQADGYTVQPAKAGPDFIDPSLSDRLATPDHLCVAWHPTAEGRPTLGTVNGPRGLPSYHGRYPPIAER